MKRKDVNLNKLAQKPCGGTRIGRAHYETTPGSRNLVSWKVLHPSTSGNCYLRVADTPTDHFDLLHVFGDVNADGSFPCGRNVTPLEAKEFRLPKDLVCDNCILQLEWKTEDGSQYRCVDFESMGSEVPECFGQCLNGGICKNGKCACPTGFSGSNC